MPDRGFPSPAALRSGEVDLVAHVQEVCDRIDAEDSLIQALLPEPGRRERLRREAEALLDRFPDPAQRPALFGLLVGVKDFFRVDGFPTKAGSKLPAELFEGMESDVVTRLKQNGALVAGKTVTTEFAYMQPGPTRNPHNPEHTPGGSSSGSAAGVAAGFYPLALGTQTIGSVIRPAAFCGIIGFKPSYDRIDTAGMLFFSKSVDHAGLFSQNVATMKLACSALLGSWDDSAGAPPDGLPVLAVPDGPYLEEAEEAGLEQFEKTLDRMAAAGLRIERVSFFPNYAELNVRHRRLTAVEVSEVHKEWYKAYSDRYSVHMHEIMETGATVSDEEREGIRADQLRLRHKMEEALLSCGADLWVAPAAPGPAPYGIHSTGNPIMNLPWTNAGVPALAVPSGEAENGLPLGVQFCAPFGADERLLAWGEAIEGLVRG
ncbi:MAG: amidase [Caldilineaceae bacterium]|nr:amidase [Caldilineaceae bacterium]